MTSFFLAHIPLWGSGALALAFVGGIGIGALLVMVARRLPRRR